MSWMRLIDALRQTDNFEAGARAALEVILDEAGAEALRGMVHLRPRGDYEGLVVVERGGPGGAPDLVPSASAWQVLSADPRPLIIDVARASARTVGSTTTRPDAQRLFSMRTTQTIARLRSRMTSTLLALPLRGHSDTLTGAISIELSGDCTSDEAVTALQALADLLALALPGLPVRTTPRPAPMVTDEQVPVVGERMERILRLLSVFALQDETLLLSGETGVGKSQLAAWCHGRSASRSGPLETVVLSTLPEEMQLPSLFGWKRGAFTGAVRDAPGAIARAEGGTLFIDEIDKLSPRAQAGLLQLLESRQYRPVGDPGALKTAEVRFIIGTNTDLAAAVAEGRFLEDLFFRINVLPVEIPPLSARIDELPGWIRFMLGRRHRKSGSGDAIEISDGALKRLAAQSWPGNLRQLSNTVSRTYAIMLADSLDHSGPPLVTLRHVEQALAMDLARPGTSALQPALDAAARALLAEARRRAPDARETVFHLADAAAALVLHQALSDEGDVKSAYTLLGRDGLVASRSHHKDFRRRMQRLQELYEALGLPIDPALAASMAL